MKSLRALLLMLPMIACLFAYGQMPFPPQDDSFTAKVYSDKNVAKNLTVENVSYAGKSDDGYKFNINGTALASSMEMPVYVWYILPGDELKVASLAMIPRRKKRDAVNAEFIVADDATGQTSLPDEILGFMLSTEAYTVADLKPGETTKEMKSASPENKSFTVVEFGSYYPGGINAIYKYLIENIKYPVAAAEKKIQGSVVVKFTINEEGKVVDPVLTKSVDPELDAEALRIVSNMGDWRPGMLRGKPMKTVFLLPVAFRLEF